MSDLRRSRPITAAEREAFAVDGVVCLRALLDAEAVGAMADPVARVVAGSAGADLTAMAEALGGDGGSQPRGRFYAGVDHWRDDDAFRAFAVDSVLPGAAAALLASDSIWLYEDSVLVKEPGTVEPTAFHTDASYFHVAGEQACTVWVPLDPVTLDTGSLIFVRGSHRWPQEFRPNLFVTPEPIPGTVGDEVPDVEHADLDLVSFDLEPGDVTVHHYRTLHGARGNSSVTTSRRAISVRYCGDDVRYRFRPGAPRKAHHHEVVDGDPLGGPDCPRVWPRG